MTKLVLILLSLFIWLQGCGTTSPTECQAVDWYELGRRQGARGLEMVPEKQIPPSCQESFDVEASRQFENGYMAGLVEFCRPEVAYTMGFNGSSAPRTG